MPTKINCESAHGARSGLTTRLTDPAPVMYGMQPRRDREVWCRRFVQPCGQSHEFLLSASSTHRISPSRSVGSVRATLPGAKKSTARDTWLLLTSGLPILPYNKDSRACPRACHQLMSCM